MRQAGLGSGGYVIAVISRGRTVRSVYPFEVAFVPCQIQAILLFFAFSASFSIFSYPSDSVGRQRGYQAPPRTVWIHNGIRYSYFYIRAPRVLPFEIGSWNGSPENPIHINNKSSFITLTGLCSTYNQAFQAGSAFLR
jgi:hypothetical protein